MQAKKQTELPEDVYGLIYTVYRPFKIHIIH